MGAVRFYLFLLALGLAVPAALAQQPSAPVVDHVLMMLTIKPGIQMPQVMKVMPDEVRATVRLYLDGKIEQWYSRGDGKGVVFILNCKSADEAKAIMDGLPLSQNHLVDLEFTPLGPLTPLRALIGPPPSAAVGATP
jgi:peptidyl-tRNA hydrolase